MLLWKRAFEKHLTDAFGQNLNIVWTDNKRLMISLQEKRGKPTLRLHQSFISAQDEVKNDLVKYLTKPKAKVSKPLRTFINGISAKKRQAGESVKVTAKGKNYNLKKIWNKLNKEYFDNRLKGKIGWGRKVFSKRKTSITFGSYHPAETLIRIHPILDTELVPLFYLESIVHHEMVHQYLHLVEEESKKGVMHSPHFKTLEKKFKYYELSQAWEKSHLIKLLKYRPAKNG